LAANFPRRSSVSPGNVELQYGNPNMQGETHHNKMDAFAFRENIHFLVIKMENGHYPTHAFFTYLMN
jgi:hypothetical protein